METALARVEMMKTIDTDSVHWQMFRNNYIKLEREQLIRELEKHIEHPNKPGYQRSDIVNRIKELRKGNETI